MIQFKELVLKKYFSKQFSHKNKKYYRRILKNQKPYLFIYTLFIFLFKKIEIIYDSIFGYTKKSKENKSWKQERKK